MARRNVHLLGLDTFVRKWQTFQWREGRGLKCKVQATTATSQGIVGCTPTNVPLWEIPI